MGLFELFAPAALSKAASEVAELEGFAGLAELAGGGVGAGKSGGGIGLANGDCCGAVNAVGVAIAFDSVAELDNKEAGGEIIPGFDSEPVELLEPPKSPAGGARNGGGEAASILVPEVLGFLKLSSGAPGKENCCTATVFS